MGRVSALPSKSLKGEFNLKEKALREGVLKVRLNKGIRNNVSFYDPLTVTLVNYKNPVSNDLNKIYYTKSLEERQLDLTNIIKGLNSGHLMLEEGSLDNFENKVAPATTLYIDPLIEEEWKKLSV